MPKQNIPLGLILLFVSAIFASVLLIYEIFFLKINIFSDVGRLKPIVIALTLVELGVALLTAFGIFHRKSFARYLVLTYIGLYGIIYSICVSGIESFFSLILIYPMYMLKSYLFNNREVVNYFRDQ